MSYVHLDRGEKRVKKKPTTKWKLLKDVFRVILINSSFTMFTLLSLVCLKTDWIEWLNLKNDGIVMQSQMQFYRQGILENMF